MAIILFSFISAADFTPQGNITLRNTYNIQNATSITIGNGTVHINPSGFFGWLNWSWLTNIPAYVKDWDYKLNATDQRYNDTAFVISYVNLNACLSNGTNCPIGVQNYWINGTYSKINSSNSQTIQLQKVLASNNIGIGTNDTNWSMDIRGQYPFAGFRETGGNYSIIGHVGKSGYWLVNPESSITFGNYSTYWLGASPGVWMTINSSGITAPSFYGDGSHLTGVSTGGGQNYWLSSGGYSTINSSQPQDVKINSLLTNSILSPLRNTPLNFTLYYNDSVGSGFGYQFNLVGLSNQLYSYGSVFTVKSGSTDVIWVNQGGYGQLGTDAPWFQLGSNDARGGSIKIQDTLSNNLFIVDMVKNRTYMGSENMSLYNYSMDLDVTGTSILNRLNVSGKDIYFTNPDSTNFHFVGTNGVTFYFNQLESSTLTFSDNEYGFYTAQPRGFIFHNANVNVTQNLTVEGCLILNGTTYCSLNNAVETNSNKTIGNFVGLTSGTHTGNLTSGATSGYTAANALCNAAFTGSHICSYAELKRSMDLHISFGTETFWSTTGFPGYTANANDCLGWTDPTETYYGPFWDPTATVDYGAGYIAPCSQTKKLGCCL